MTYCMLVVKAGSDVNPSTLWTSTSGYTVNTGSGDKTGAIISTGMNYRSTLIDTWDTNPPNKVRRGNGIRIIKSEQKTNKVILVIIFVW